MASVEMDRHAVLMSADASLVKPKLNSTADRFGSLLLSRAGMCMFAFGVGTEARELISVRDTARPGCCRKVNTVNSRRDSNEILITPKYSGVAEWLLTTF